MTRFLAIILAFLCLSSPVAAQTISGGYSPSSADPRISTGALSQREIGARVGIANQKSGSQTRAGFRVWETNYVGSPPSICVWNGYSNSAVAGVETGTGGVMSLKLYIEYPLGTTTALTWGGAATSSIASNAVQCSDPSPVAPPAFAKYRLCGDIQMGTGGTIPSMGWSNSADPSGGDEFQGNTTSDYCASATALAKPAAQAFMPQLILGQSDKTVWAVGGGDSITAGVNYTQQQPSGGRGMLAALAEFGPVLNYGVPGDRATWYATNSTIRRQMLGMGGATSIVDELGINDITNSRSLANLLADRSTIRGLFPGLSVFETTIPPTTSSVDGYRTAANQTVAASSTVRVSFNQAMRAGVSGVAGVLDFAAEVETKPAFVGTASFATNVMTVTAVTTGRIDVGDVITSAGVAAGTYVTSLGSGTGGAGTYNLSTAPGTIAAQAVTAPANEVGSSIDGGVWQPRCIYGSDGTHPVEQCERQSFAPLVRAMQATRR